MQPLSHGITAVYLFLLYFEQNAALKSWDDDQFLVLLVYRKETLPLSHGITAVY